MIKNKHVARTMITAFLILLACLFSVTVFGKKETYSFFENRMLAAFPEPNGSAMSDGTLFAEVDRYLSDHTAFRDAAMRIKTMAEMRVLRKPVVNEVVVGEDDLLSYLGYGVFPQEKIEEQAEQIADNLAAHRDTVESVGGHFCLIAVPCQYVVYSERYPWYLDNRADYTKRMHEALFERLEARGIEYMDMGAFMETLPEMEKDVFASDTDNHYLIDGAWYVYEAMMDKITSDWGGSPDVLGKDDFSLTYLTNEYLGSYRRKLFGLVDNKERFPILIPKTEIPFTRTQSGTAVPSSVYAIPSPDEYALYTVYMGGDMPQTTIETNRPALPDLLIYGDSFTNPVECLAYTGFDRMDSLDLRYYSALSLDTYIRQMHPDYVFCIRDYESILDASSNGQ